MTKTLIGYLRATSIGEYFMDCQDGTLEVVYGAKGIPTNKLIALCVHAGDTPYGVRWVVDSAPDKRYSLLAEDPAEETNHKRVAFFRVVPYGSSDEVKAKWQKKVDEMARRFQWNWQYHNRNWIIECRGYVMEYEGVTGSPSYCRSQTQAFYDAGNCGDFHPNYWAIWGGSGGKCGTGILGGNRMVIYDNAGCGQHTADHEGGHVFGMHHAGHVSANGVVSEYGDDTDLLSADGWGFNSPHMIQMNMDTGREIKIVDHTQQVLIVPIECSYHSMHEQTDQHILVKQLDAPTLHVSLRKDRGYKFAKIEGAGDRLYVHILEKDGKTKMLDPYMRVGDYRMFERVKVEYLGYDKKMEIARVNIYYHDDIDKPDDLPMPTGLPQNIPSIELDETYNGTWHDARFSGQGLNVVIKNGVVGVYWFTVDREGNPAYLLGGCEIKDGVETFPLYKTRGGTFDNPTSYTEEQVGIAQVYFYGHTKDENGNDTTRGVFVYQCSDYGNGSIEITPAGPLTTDPRNGVRFDPAKIGSGFAIQYYNQMMNEAGELEDRISMSWYTYDYQRRQLWFSCEGVKRPTGLYGLTLYEVLGVEFGYFSDVVFKPVGFAMWYPETNIFDYALESDKVHADGMMTLSEEAI